MTMNHKERGFINPCRIAMACFVEGIDPATLSLGTRHLIQVEEVLSQLKKEIPTIAYHGCLESLASRGEEEEV